MSTYDLRAAVKAVLDTTSLTDPGEIADKVVESIPGSALRTALRITMRAYVRQINREGVTLAAPNFGSGQERRETHTRTAAAGQSWKCAGIRDGWQRIKASRVFVGNETYKLFRECTHEDFGFMADLRDKKAHQNAAWARKYHEIQAAMTEHSAQVFDDLPVEVQMRLLGATS